MSGFFRTLLGVEQTVQANPLPIKTPDITHTQFFVALQFAASVAVGAAVLSPAEGQVLIGASGVIGTGIAIADAIIRHGRSNAIAAKILASVSGGGGHMGVAAPKGTALPPAPTAEDWPDEGDPHTTRELGSNAVSPPNPAPPAPAVPPEHIEEARRQAEAAQEAAQAASDRLQALQRQAAAPQQSQ